MLNFFERIRRADESTCGVEELQASSLASSSTSTQSPNSNSTNFGIAVLKCKANSKLTDYDRYSFLQNRWILTNNSDLQVSKHMKEGKLRSRFFNKNHLEQFKWLAISKEGTEGAW